MSFRTLVRNTVAVVAATATILLVFADPVRAADAIDMTNLDSVLNNARLALAGVLAGLATLFFMIGAILYLAARGNRRDVERAKQAMASAALGYLLAAAAPLVVTILQKIAGL